MGSGFLSGIFWGGLLGLLALFVSSQALERQTLSFPKPEAAAVEVPGGSEFNQARPETDPIVPDTDEPPSGSDVAATPEAEPSADTPPAMDTAALPVPVPSTTQEAPETLGAAPAEVSDVTEPQSASDSAIVSAVTEDLSAPEAPGAAPDAETAEVAAPTGAEIADDGPNVASAEDSAPTVESAAASEAPQADDQPLAQTTEGTPQVASQFEAPDTPVAPEVGADNALPWLTEHMNSLDSAPEAPAAPDVASEPSLPPAGTNAPEAPVAADAGSTGENAVDAAVEEALASADTDTGAGTVESAPAPSSLLADREDAEQGAADSDVSEATDEDVATDTDSTVLQPVETLTERAPEGIESGELPVVRRLGNSGSVVDDSEEDTTLLDLDEPASGDESAELESGTETSGPALEVFSSAFEAPNDLPLMSIVLVQTGSEPLSPGALELLPPHVAFAVDASQSDASSLARTYRDAGREVVVIPTLPEGATPQDVEQALSVNFDRVPEAVAVMDVSGSSFQSDRDAVAQVVDVVAASGHGLITFPRGLNAAHQQAQRVGVPTGLIFRNLDGSGETQEQIRRSLDRAAFRARRDEAVILVGTTGTTTLSALTEWVLGNRAATVAIAPVSAALGG